MPEFPDIELYLHALRPRVQGSTLNGVRINSPFLLRSVQPPLSECCERRVMGLARYGKRIVFLLEDEYALVLHLMIAGRLQWKDTPSTKLAKRVLAQFEFSQGALQLTEAGTKRRASLYAVQGEVALQAHDPGGLEVTEATLAQFAERLQSANHTLKRALTDPRLFSGIGNAYSDEILHAARLSPVQLTSRLNDAQVAALFDAVLQVLQTWAARLIEHAGDKFPLKVTAFRPQMAVHGRFGQPCPVCETSVQRIRYASNETNYCPRCQTGGKLLADRALSRLLKKDWPRSIEELEKLRS